MFVYNPLNDLFRNLGSRGQEESLWGVVKKHTFKQVKSINTISMMKQLLPFSFAVFKCRLALLCLAGFQAYTVCAQTSPVYKQISITADGSSRIESYAGPQVALRSSLPVQVQQNDRLQALLDGAALRTTENMLVVDLAQYPDDLVRTRPLYVRTGVKTVFVNGTMTRSAELRDSATVVISQGSQVEWGEGAVLTAEGRCTGHELIAIEWGSLTVSAGEIRDARNTAEDKDDAAVTLYNEKCQFTLSGGSLVNTLGVVNNGGGMVRLQKGKILGGLVFSPVDLWLDGGMETLGAIVNLDRNAKIYVTSALKTEVSIWVMSTANFGPHAGGVIAAGYERYTLSANDLKCFRYVEDAQALSWQFALQNNQIVLALPDTPSFENGKELQDYLSSLASSGQQGTEKDPVNIFLPVDKPIEINAPLQVPAKAHVAFNGGRLVRGIALRSSAAAQAMLEIPKGSSLSLEQTFVDGGKQEAVSPLVTVEGKLTLGAGSLLTGGNPQDEKASSGIYIAPSGQMRLEGGLLEGNESTARGVIENAGELIIASGFVQKNQSDHSVIVNQDNSRFQMTGGVLEANRSEEAVGAAIVFGKDCHVSIEKGYIYSGAETEIDTQSDIHLRGAATIKGNVILREGTKLRVSSYLQSDIHVVYQADDMQPGTVIACGIGGYTLTRQDKERIKKVSGAYDFVLENGNIVIMPVATANEWVAAPAFQAMVQAGRLVLSGVEEGTSFRIYDARGELVGEGRVSADRTLCRLPGKGIYFIVCKEACVKVLNR